MKYAGIYPVARPDIQNPRRREAAARIAAYILRRAARTDGYTVTGNYTISIAEPNGYFDPEPKDHAIRIEAMVVPLASQP